MSLKKGPKILVIDDEKEFCALLQEFFEDEGYSVEVSYDGEAGLEKARSFEPDIILLDIRMPHMNGIEALKKIKGFFSAPVICVSAITNSETVKECLNNGATAYIFKPIDLDDLKLETEAALKECP
jgi:DNA-binding response OmpR family regulator